MRIEKAAAFRVIHDEPRFSELLLAYLLSRNIRIEEDLGGSTCSNLSEKRLARVLLLLAKFGSEHKPEPVIPERSAQETLAEIVRHHSERASVSS